jgi:hypothetical protein
MITRQEIVLHARTMIGLKTVYLLGAGGMHPDALHPWDNERGRHSDCSGFVAWCCGYSRFTHDPFYTNRNGGWINTDAIVADGANPGGLFTRVDRAQPGDIIVFPGGVPGHSIGHVGVISQVDASGKPTRVIHCSGGNYRTTGDAVQETPPDVFATPKTMLVRFDPAAAAPEPHPPVVAHPQGVTLTGKMSTFGGPQDRGVGEGEDLALLVRQDIINPSYAELFLPEQPRGTTGLARRLNPQAFYIAMRWNYSTTPKAFLRNQLLRVENPANRMFHFARPVDWGPNEDTDRIADLSPGLAEALGLETDDVCRVLVPVPQPSKGDPF